MAKPLVAVASLGGTITMTSSTGTNVQPTLSADDLILGVPGLSAVADLKARTVATKPGASLGVDDLEEAMRWIREAVDAGAAGAVVIQGTDTIEESAYLLDLHWDREEPLIVTGAMRHPGSAGADGPGNLLAAVTAAASPRSSSRGVMVVLNDTIHAASRVQKGQGSGLDAFVSRPFGPLGVVVEGQTHFTAPAGRYPALTGAMKRPIAKVALLETHFGDDGSLVDLAVAAGYQGIIIGAFGVGHVSAAVAESISRAVASVPVVFATRTGAGTTFTQTYGFNGSESDLLHRGAIGAGWLLPRQARMLLERLIAGGSDRSVILEEFARRGALPDSANLHLIPETV
ncbi:asparaginase [Paenarthrobacter sp. NCHU4564]|uniref:asparaginase n=1 Tax=Paenarthrobacter sp. NCHU4564 TaxID=3451353 RepID=UPI003F9D8753